MSHRLFIGLRPPQSVRDVLLSAMDGIEMARWQSDAQLHVTLRFLGEMARPDANELAEALGHIRLAPFAVEVEGVGHFERKLAAKAVWARIKPSVALDTLKKKIDRVCRALGIEDDHRKFMAHITLARLNSSSGPIGHFLARHADLHSPAFMADRFILFESRMGQGGSHYEAIADYPLR